MSGENDNKDIELPIVTDDLQPTSIDITSDDLGGDLPAGGAPATSPDDVGAAPGAAGSRKAARVAKLASERDAERSRATEAERRAAEAEARAEAAERERLRSDHAAMGNFEALTKHKLEVAKQRLEDAISTGDSKKQAELTSDISALQNELGGIEAWKQANPLDATTPPRQPEPKQPAAPAQPAPPQVQLQPDTKAWIDSNAWFQPGNPDFDPEMHTEARSYAASLERKLKREGREAEIGNAAYFAEIDKHMKAEFPEAFDDDEPAPAPAPKRQVPPTNGGTPSVLPPGRTSAGGGDSRATSTTRVELSAAERSLSHSLAANGAIKNPDGSRPTPQQAERLFAIQKLKTQKVSA